MGKIEVGEYIRTESGIIAKVLSELYEYKDGYKRDYDNDILNDWYNDGIIVKHSKNIIDLIEVGDYINGDEVIAVDYEEDEKHNYFDILGVYCIEDDYAYTIRLTDINIKTILTKEAFQFAEYRVETN